MRLWKWCVMGVLVWVLVACSSAADKKLLDPGPASVEVSSEDMGSVDSFAPDLIGPDLAQDLSVDVQLPSDVTEEMAAETVVADLAADQGSTCFDEGAWIEVPGPAATCCPWLESIPDCVNEGLGQPACKCTEGIMCTLCGNGKCGPGENECNCPEDCPLEVPNICVQDGGKCEAAPTGDGCPYGSGPVDLPGCADGLLCCMPDGEMCAGKGEMISGVPDDTKCCDSLAPIAVAQVDPATGECVLLIGGSVCADCGDGVCETDFENMCNCPADCPLVPGECYGPYVVCPDGDYCKYPEASCDSAGAVGNCTEIPMFGCEKIYSPVCGCDGVTYDNECFMEAQSMSMMHPGQCDETQCLPAGGTFTDFEVEGKCCPGLVPVSDCIQDAAGNCACPNCPCYICTYCGDGICGEYEHACNCNDCI